MRKIFGSSDSSTEFRLDDTSTNPPSSPPTTVIKPPTPNKEDSELIAAEAALQEAQARVVKAQARAWRVANQKTVAPVVTAQALACDAALKQKYFSLFRHHAEELRDERLAREKAAEIAATERRQEALRRVQFLKMPKDKEEKVEPQGCRCVIS